MTNEPAPIILSIDAFAARRGVKPATVRRWIRTGKLTRVLPDGLIDVLFAEDELVSALDCRQGAKILAAQLAETLRFVCLEVSKAAGPHERRGYAATKLERDRLARLLPAIGPELHIALMKVRVFRAAHFGDFDQPPAIEAPVSPAAPSKLPPTIGSSFLNLLSSCSEEALMELKGLLQEEMTLEHRRGELMRKWAAFVGRLANQGSAAPKPQLRVIG